jgi:sterol desaturase/sphingolipid hydroxylase (fatty acid hydroxylase superfamily)
LLTLLDMSLTDLLTHFTDGFGSLQTWLFEAAVQPLMYAAGCGNLAEDAYDATGWLLVGLIQLTVLLAVLGPLERLRAVEPRGPMRSRATDVLYTLIHRLGVFRVAMFFSVEPLLDQLFGTAAVHGWNGIQLDSYLAPLWPGVSDTAWASFLVYLLAFDLLDYWIHRGQHQWNPWWALHAVHHSQRHMTMWTDNRNHLVDDLMRDVIIAFTARAIGVPPGQFISVVAVTQLMESLSHVNARITLGWLGERLVVGPRFHRLHHAIGLGHEGHLPGTLGGCNFAVLFPVWDLIFGTARFDGGYEPTGIRDQLPGQGGVDYGEGFWRQQALGMKRLWRALLPG